MKNWIAKDWIKLACIIVASVIVAKMTVLKQPNPTVSGRLLSEWVEALDDQDDAVVAAALDKIYKVDKEQCGRAKKRLRELSEELGNADKIRGRASVLLQLKFGESSPESIDSMITVVKHDDFKWSSEAGRALGEMQEHSEEVINALVGLLSGQDTLNSQATAVATTTIVKFGRPALIALKNAPEIKNYYVRDDVDEVIKALEEKYE